MTPPEHHDRRQAPVVLVVGDDRGTIEILARLLERDGLRAVRARGAEAGLEQAGAMLPRCVVVDLPRSGVGSTLQVIGWLRSHADERVATTRIIAVDGGANRDVLLASGADTCLVRPLHGRAVLAAVDDQLATT